MKRKRKHSSVPQPKSAQRARPTRAVDYPSPQERGRIIERRDELMYQVISALVSESELARDQRIQQLVRRYGPQEVAVVLAKFQKGAAGRDLLSEEPLLYRQYRQTFARFGGHRRFLGRPEFEELSYEHVLLFGKRKFKSLLPFKKSPGKRERELQELLLKDALSWPELFPPDVPPRPAEAWATAPAPGAYDDPARDLLKWGWDWDDQRIAQQARNAARWRPAISDLARMALDEGLLESWPGEPASWAPYHALHLLGHLQACDYARPLLTLLQRPNDWLSDQLIGVWVQMGLPVEPVLWAYLGDLSHPAKQRGLVLAGLEKLAATFPAERAGIASKLTGRLQAASADDGNEAEMNGYIVFVLNRMGVREAQPVIDAAFEQGKVDTGIMRREDVKLGG